MNRAANIEPAPSVISPSEPGRAELLRFYRTLVLIRRSELTTQTMYRNRELPGFAHLYIGQEATAVGVMAHLRPDDWITSTHRGHGHALAKGVPPKMLLAELAGKATGCNGGRGGTHAPLSCLRSDCSAPTGWWPAESPRPSAWPLAPRPAAPTR